jgi:hypothetical protein
MNPISDLGLRSTRESVIGPCGALKKTTGRSIARKRSHNGGECLRFAGCSEFCSELREVENGDDDHFQKAARLADRSRGPQRVFGWNGPFFGKAFSSALIVLCFASYPTLALGQSSSSAAEDPFAIDDNFFSREGRAQPPTSATVSESEAFSDVWEGGEPSPWLVEWLRQQALRNLPEQIEERKDWGGQIEVLDGWNVDWDDSRLKTKRRWKMANHGLWKRYSIHWHEPEKELKLQVLRLDPIGPTEIRTEVRIEAPLELFARASQYRWDVQMWSLSLQARARVRLDLVTRIRVQSIPTEVPPAIRIEPHVEEASATLTEWRVERISQIQGPMAEALGESLERLIEDKIAESNQHLADKINRAIAKKSDGFRFSFQEWLKQSAAKRP